MGAVALIAGCAGGPSRTDCAGADWTALGFEDGAKGARQKLFEERAGRCADSGIAPDATAYESGRADGLNLYCTADGGFSAGAAGEKYQAVCAPPTEPAFLTGYQKGARLFALTTAHEQAIDAYDGAIADLDQHQYLLGVAEKRYAKPSISNEDRENERQEVEHRSREISRLEKSLPGLLFGIEASRAALDAYKAALRDEGRAID